MAFWISCSTLTFPLVLLFYSLSVDIYYIPLYIIPHFLLLSATNSSLLPTLSFSIFLHFLLLVHYDVTKLSLLSTPHPLVHTLFFPLIPNLYLLTILSLTTLLLLLSSFISLL